jgi:hypothetical protein
MLALAVQHYDFVLLDIGRPIDTLSDQGARPRQHRIFPVLQAGLPSIRNAKKMLAIFKSLDYSADKIELIINRFDRKARSASPTSNARWARSSHTVPNSYKQVTASIDHGDPLMTSAAPTRCAQPGRLRARPQPAPAGPQPANAARAPVYRPVQQARSESPCPFVKNSMPWPGRPTPAPASTGDDYHASRAAST